MVEPNDWAVLFDMDGVLIDSEPAHEAAINEAVVDFGLAPFSKAVFERYFYGRTDYSGFVDYLTAIDRLDLTIADLMVATAVAYERRFATDVRGYADALDSLRTAAMRGYRVAIVSGARNREIDLVVDRFELAPYLTAIIGGDDVPTGKPDPAPYLAGANRLDFPPERCVVIEDAPAGIASARAAGMRCLAVQRSRGHAILSAADRIVDTVTVEAIEGLMKQD
ncbi:MAG TPA: HAD family phosphatase [Nitrolancea sp.]|nr:HAD family phosphatase [Nitrolancea sp.]